MPFDAADLYWPPFGALYDRLEAIKLDPEAVEASSLKSTLQEYSSWLAKGLRGFKKPSDASKRALETETHLIVGPQKLPVEAGLRGAAFTTSRALVSCSLFSLITRSLHTPPKRRCTVASVLLTPYPLPYCRIWMRSSRTFCCGGGTAKPPPPPQLAPAGCSQTATSRPTSCAG